MSVRFYDEPKNKLPRATGMGDHRFTFGERSVESLISPFSGLPNLSRKAVREPGVTKRTYFEENGYEYEYHATYDAATNSIVTNDIRCPNSVHHHIGSMCSVCGQDERHL